MNLQQQYCGAVGVSRASVRYVLERKGARVEFLDRSAVIEFLRDFLPPPRIVTEDATNADIAVMASGRS